MSVSLDSFGIDLKTADGMRSWFSLRPILQAIAEDEQAMDMIGKAIVNAPMPSTIMSVEPYDGPFIAYPKFDPNTAFESVASLAVDDGDSGL